MDNKAYIETENEKGNANSARRRQKERENIPLKNDIVKSPYTKNTHHLSPPEKSAAPGRVEIPRNITLYSACALIIGSVIGSGIFVSPKGVLKGAGSVGMTLVIWVLCGFFSLIGSLTYCELTTLIPESGGDYIYLLEAFAPNRRSVRSWWREVIPFVHQWQGTILGPASLAVQGLISGTYLVKLGLVKCSGGEAEELRAIRCIAIFMILLISFFNCYSIKLAVKIQNVLSTTKVFALVLIIIGGIFQLSSGDVGILNTGFEGSRLSSSGISEAFYSGLWAYSGWQGITKVTREIKNPSRDVPLAFITSSLLITFVYTGTMIAYFSVLTKEDILGSDAVAESFGRKLLGFMGASLMIFSVAASTAGSAHGGLFQAGRSIYVAASENHMLEMMSYIHITRFTPIPAIVFSAMMAILYLLVDIFSLISVLGFADSLLSGLTMATVIYFRYSKKDAERPFKVPLVIPVIAILFQLFLFITPLLDNPSPKYLIAFGVQLLGVLVYTLFVYFRLRLPGINNLKVLVQKLFMVVPIDK